jgi:hypothetical protein
MFSRIKSAWLILVLLIPFPAQALQVSSGALRIEDKKEGNLVVGAEDAQVESTDSYRTVLLLWGKLEVYGSVDELIVLSGHVHFHPGAKLSKSLVLMGGSYEAEAGASVANESIVFRNPGPAWRMVRSAGNVWRENFNWVAAVVASLFVCGILFLFGFILFRAFPALRGVLVGKIEPDWIKNLLVGFLALCIVPVFAVLMVISIFGLFLLPLFFLLLAVAGLISYCASALWVGQRMLVPKDRQQFRALSLLAGLLAFQLLWLAGSWGMIVVFAIWTLGWGALVRSLRALWK